MANMEVLAMGDPLIHEKVKPFSFKLDSISSVPLYSQITGYFLAAINEGRYREGDKLPTEQDICEMFDVSRITARKAVQELVDLGKVERKQGKGTFILSSQVSMYALAMDGFGGFAAHSAGVSKTQIVSKRFGAATEKEAAWLKIKPGSPIQELVRSLSLDGVPIMLDRALYSQERFPGLIDDLQDSDSTYARLSKRYQCTIHAIDKEISYTLARPDEAATLQCNVGEPLYFISKSVMDKEKNIIHHAISLVVASRVKLTFSYSR